MLQPRPATGTERPRPATEAERPKKSRETRYHAADNLADYSRTLSLSACRRVLAEGRAMRITGRWTGVGGDDVRACWKRTLSAKRMLPLSYDLIVSYLDTAPPRESLPSRPLGTVVMSHGTPGSHIDFKYIIPVLIEKDIRVLAPNFPGHGFTDAPSAFRQSNDERAEFLADFVSGVGLKEADVIVGHCGGCYPLLKLAADDQFSTSKGPICRSLVLVNPGGTTKHHKAARPHWIARLGARLHHTRLRPLVGRIECMVWNYALDLPMESGEAAAAGTDVVANVGLSRVSAKCTGELAVYSYGPRLQMPSYVRRLTSDPRTPRVLMLYAEDDPLIEKRGEETAALLGVARSKIFKVSIPEDVECALRHVRAWTTTKNGPRHAAIAFGKGMGGHYLQKYQAAFIASCLEILVSE